MNADPPPAAPIETRVLGRIAEVASDTWDALVDDDDSPFVEHAWLDALEQTGCAVADTGWAPAHLTVWRAGALVGAAPMYVKSHSAGEFVFDWGWADFAATLGVSYYPKLVIGVPFTPATGARVLTAPGEDREQILAHLAAAAKGACARLGASGAHVLFAREKESAAWVAAGFLPREGYQYHFSRDGARTFDDYLSRFSSKQRNQIKREIRSIEHAGIVVRTLSPQEHTAELARAMHRFYSATIERHRPWGQLYLTLPFFERVVQTFRHRLAWVVAQDTASGAVIGGAFNVTGGRRLFGRYWGADADVANLHFVVCYYAGVACCLERGLDVFEPGAGGEHKRARGFSPTLTRSAHFLADVRLREALRPWLARERAQVRGLVAEPGGKR